MSQSIEERAVLTRKIRRIAISIISLIFIVAQVDGIYNFVSKRELVQDKRGTSIDMDLVNSYIDEGKIVVINVQADWCLTCKYNDVAVFSNPFIERLMEKENIKVIDIDWTNYDKDVLAFMEKYGRKGLPFYIVYSKNIPDGVVLPEILNESDFSRIVLNLMEN